MTEMTLPLATSKGSQTFVGSPARAAYLVLAAAFLVVGLAGRPAPVAAPEAPLNEALVAQYSAALEVVEPVAGQLPTAVVVIEGLAPVVNVEPAAPVRLDGVSDRDGWARERVPGSWRPARVSIVAQMLSGASLKPAPVTTSGKVLSTSSVISLPATGAKALPATESVKVVPETPAALKAPIARAAAKYGLPSDVLSAALARESANFKDRYVYGYHVDGTGRGVAGIDKKYHPDVTDEQAFDPNFAIDWMGRYLSSLVRKNGGDVYSALREYNGGPNFASGRLGYQGRTVNELTKRHADTIMAHAARAIAI
jgi:hypothetical protein